MPSGGAAPAAAGTPNVSSVAAIPAAAHRRMIRPIRASPSFRAARAGITGRSRPRKLAETDPSEDIDK
ncbi:hypothetical protein Sya03_42140 [Spirilliplanes yamanashiensis]|uniref:Uncharacterized protein n=1 Tax=Spirilliplanes yamanashiensis TaxID=42233 RepID=A0A8J3YBR8_9ACTN|nr:hypothetical protein Sya03_42140 [Spirilliplanes yamanashiensis]